MKQILKSVAGALAATAWLCASSSATQVPSRIAGAINSSQQVEIAGTATHRPATSTVVGHLPGNTAMTRMGLVLAPSTAQQADLDQLLAAQVNPKSANYHQWLTPAQFGARFGVSDADLTKIESWLTSQGFEVLSVPASRNTVFFSGTAAGVETAFGVTMQQYRRNGQQFFENSGNIKVPAALNGIVQGITSLSSYRLKGNLIERTKASLKSAKPAYTTTTDGTTVNSLTPWDFRQIYGLNTLVNAGYTGQVKIAVVGQSAVDTSQINIFQQLTGQTTTTPTLVLVPNSGTSTLVSGDEGESEIDLEYSGGTASGASIQFVYTGNGDNNGVFDSLIYAVTQDLAPIITMSYGGCETDYTTYASQTFEPYLRQANAQGQTVLVSAGDEDAATCDVVDSSSGTATIASEGATVSYPASSVYVTAVGGTRFNEGSGTYWNSTNNSFGGSATGYIPEIVWNETNDPMNISNNGGDIVGTGGGASALFGKPSWQTGTGVPSDGARDLPDVAFNAAIYHDPYEYCSAETTYGTGAEACTTSGFSGYIVGGTSLSAPNFAAMLAIVEQKNGITAGLGNINTSIYSLAAGSSASAVFNDVTSGNNIVPCIVGTPDCTSGTLGFVAGVGYDQTTGWGSVNGAAFATALAAQVATPTATPTVTVSANPAAPIINTSVTLTASVASASSTTVPTGTVQFSIDGTSVGTQTLASGSAVYTVAAGFTTAGTHTVVAAYSGDSNYSAATSNLTLIVGASVSSSGTFTLTSSPATLSISSGSSGSETITATRAGGYLGVVSFVATASGTSTLNACYTLPNATVATSGGSATMNIYTSTSECATAGRIPIRNAAPKKLAINSQPAGPDLPRKPAAILLGGALLGCFALRRRSRLPLLFTLALCAALIPSMGCGSGSGGSTSPISGGSGSGSGGGTTGTNYTITVTGASSTNASLTSSTSFTLNIQ